MDNIKTSFDFVESASKAYRFVWARRVDIARLSAVFIALKIASFVGIAFAGMGHDLLRQGIVMMPVFLMEGWVIAQVMVMALYKDVSDTMRGRSVLPHPDQIARNIKASMVLYALTKLGLSFIVGATMASQQDLPETASTPEPGFAMFVISFMLLGAIIYCFRFVWLYVPMIMGMRPLPFLNHFKAFGNSFNLIGAFILCFVPLMLVMLFLSMVVHSLLVSMGFDGESFAVEIAITIIQAVMDFGVSLLSSVAIAFGLYSVLSGENKKTSLF